MKEKITKWLQNYFWTLLFSDMTKIEVYKEFMHYMEGMEGMLTLTKDLTENEVYETRDMLSRYITKYARKIQKMQ